jgi:hypothetical protein
MMSKGALIEGNKLVNNVGLCGIHSNDDPNIMYDGVVVATKTGTASLTVKAARWGLTTGVVEIVAGGANASAGTATFRYSLDNGATWSATLPVPALSMVDHDNNADTAPVSRSQYVSGGDAGTFTWVDGSFVAGDRWTFTGSARGLGSNEGLRIAHNYVKDCIIPGNGSTGIAADYCRSPLFEGNTVINARCHLNIINGGQAIDAGFAPRIIGNHCEGTSAWSNPAFAPAYISVDNETVGAVIANNVLGATTEALNVAINCRGPGAIVANNNVLEDAGGQLLSGHSSNSSAGQVITGNVFRKTALAPTGSVVGIYGDGVVFTNNTLEHGGAGYNGVRLAGNNCVVSGNRIMGLKTGGVTNAGGHNIHIPTGFTGCVVTGNNFSGSLTSGGVQNSDGAAHVVDRNVVDGVLTASAITVPDASESTPGLVSTGTQTFGGNKIIANNLTVVGSFSTQPPRANSYGSLVTAVGFGGLRNGETKLQLFHDALTANALTQDIQLCTIKAWMRIRYAYLHVIEAFTGPPGTLTVQIGTSSGGNNILLAQSVLTTGQFGAEAHLGADMVRTALVQGAFVPSMSATTTLWARVTASSNLGNGTVTNLTDGSCYFIFGMEAVG